MTPNNIGYVSVPPSGDREMTKDQEEIAMLTVKLASAFLFNVGFHTKKSVRGTGEFTKKVCEISY